MLLSSIVLAFLVVSGIITFRSGYVYYPDGVSMENNDNYNQANIAFHNGDTQTGIQYLTLAAQDGFRHPYIYSRLAMQSGYLERYEEALLYSKKAIDIIESNDIKVMFLNELEAFKEDKRPATLANIYSLHAAILYSLDNNDQAEEYANKAHMIHPEDPRSLEVLGKLSIDKQDYSRAIEIFLDFTKKSPKYHDAYYYLGKAYMKTGKKEQAIEAFNSYLTRVPASNPNAKDASSRLNSLLGHDPNTQQAD